MKKTIETEFYVRVDPRGLGNFGYASMSDRLIEPDEEKRKERYRQMCEEIEDSIKRHIDDVGFTSVESETESICEFCGSQWTEDTDDYNGGCCDEDESNNPES